MATDEWVKWLNTGTTSTANTIYLWSGGSSSPPKKKAPPTALDWLDGRVDEMARRGRDLLEAA